MSNRFSPQVCGLGDYRGQTIQSGGAKKMKHLILSLSLLCTVLAAEEGFATYYTTKSCQREGTSGVFTANGERFDESALTCARRSREWGSTFKVTNLENGKSIVVRLNDFGPGKGPTAKGVIIDLTPEGFKQLGAGKKGKLKVSVELVARVTSKRKG
jgi:rare lipoprotein A